MSLKELFWISLFNNLLLIVLDIYTVNDLRLQDGFKIMLQSGNLSIDKVIFFSDFVFLVLIETFTFMHLTNALIQMGTFVKEPTQFVIYK